MLFTQISLEAGSIDVIVVFLRTLYCTELCCIVYKVYMVLQVSASEFRLWIDVFMKFWESFLDEFLCHSTPFWDDVCIKL